MDFRVPALTVSDAEPSVAPGAEAVMVVTPTLFPVASPVLLIVAYGFVDAQVSGVLILYEWPSL
jgi:hypothetical protein